MLNFAPVHKTSFKPVVSVFTDCPDCPSQFLRLLITLNCLTNFVTGGTGFAVQVITRFSWMGANLD